MKDAPFIGAKVALFLGKELVVILRDVDRDIPWPGWWDFPGGGREGDETPEEVVIRETREELGLTLRETELRGKRRYTTSTGAQTWFFAAHLPEGWAGAVRFGDEGQCWELWSISAFMDQTRAIPHFKERLRAYLQTRGHHI